VEKRSRWGRAVCDLVRAIPRWQRRPSLPPGHAGPVDLRLLWGQRLLFHDSTTLRLLKDLLALVVQTYIQFMGEWIKDRPSRRLGSGNWGLRTAATSCCGMTRR